MEWIERLGKYFALALLAFMWPVVDAFSRGLIAPNRAGVCAVTAATYCVIYGWYCLLGHKRPGWAVPVGTVLLLTVLAAALEHLIALPNLNFFLIPLMVAGFRLAPRPAVITIGAITAISIADSVLVANKPASSQAVQVALYVPGLLLFGGGAMALRYLITTVAELRAARAETAHHAADRERARIARDLHDLLGHSLSLITLKGELATRLLPEGAAGTNEVRDMLALSRQALQQVREAVSGYRHPTLATELTAAGIALRAAGIELDVRQSVGAVDRETEAVLGWVIRETTTNVIRHSGAKRCSITLTQEGGLLQVEVVNDGWRVVQRPPGNGLRGLEERLASVGGTLEALPLTDGGFRVHVAIREGASSRSVRTAEGIST